MKGANKTAIYVGLGVLVVLAIVLIYFQVNKTSETSSTGDEIKDCGEGTVVYLNEELCWQKSTSPTHAENWKNANDYCENLTLGGEDDWRLPALAELETIVAPAKDKLSIDAEYFDDTENTYYWTSSEANPGTHWFIYFEAGHAGYAQDFIKNYGIRCVRENTLF